MSKEREYGFLMCGFDLPQWDVFVKTLISPLDLTGDGLELTPHCTIIGGLYSTVSVEDVKTLCLPLKQVYVTATEIDFFSNPEYDVVKFKIESPLLSQMNEIMKTLPHEQLFPIYQPHITLGYVKKGLGEKYLKPIKPLVLQPINYMYSLPNNQTLYFTA